MTHQRIEYDPYRPIYPSPVGLITCMDDDLGRANIITLGEVFNLSIRTPVIVGIAIAPGRYTHEVISRTGEFIVNLPTAELLPKALQCGTSSGRKVDKFAEFGLTALPAAHVRAPLIAECPVNIECRVLSVQTIGDHDLFAGEVLVHHVSPELLSAEGKIDAAKLSTIVLAGGHFYGLGEHLKAWR